MNYFTMDDLMTLFIKRASKPLLLWWIDRRTVNSSREAHVIERQIEQLQADLKAEHEKQAKLNSLRRDIERF